MLARIHLKLGLGRVAGESGGNLSPKASCSGRVALAAGRGTPTGLEHVPRDALESPGSSVRKRSSPTIPSGIRRLAPPVRRRARSQDVPRGVARLVRNRFRACIQHRRTSTSFRGGRGSLSGLRRSRRCFCRGRLIDVSCPTGPRSAEASGASLTVGFGCRCARTVSTSVGRPTGLGIRVRRSGAHRTRQQLRDPVRRGSKERVEVSGSSRGQARVIL